MNQDKSKQTAPPKRTWWTKVPQPKPQAPKGGWGPAKQNGAPKPEGVPQKKWGQ